MATTFYETRWGSLRLWCSEIVTQGGRNVVTHELSSGDAHPLTDRGRQLKTCQVSLLFDEFPGEAMAPIDRLRAFEELADSDDERMFTHPVSGPYLVKISDFSYRVDADGNIVDAVATFLASEPVTAVNPAGMGASPATGTDALGAFSAELLADLDDVGIESTVPTDAVAMQVAWGEAEDLQARDVVNDVARISASLQALIEDEGLEQDLALWPAYRSAIMFGAAVRAAALAATSEVPTIFVMRIQEPISVLALVVKVYGGADAELRERQVRSLNDLRFTGGLLEPGDIVMPARSDFRRVF